MLTKTILAAGALLSMTAAIPMQQQNKRDVVWETKIEEAYTTVDVTTTLWLNPGETPPVAPAGEAEKPGHYGHGHHGNHGHHTKVTSHIKSTITVPAPSEQPTEPAPAPETTSSYVAPVPTTSTWVAPTPSSPAPVPSSPAPAASSPAAVESSAPPAYSAPAQPSSGGGSAPSGETHTGDITYYTPGMGSCGIVSTEAEAVVALPEAMMAAKNGANPNDNPYCGKSITITYGGKTTSAKVVDTCPGCSGGSIDLSPTVFTDLAQLSAGRVSGVKWWFD